MSRKQVFLGSAGAAAVFAGAWLAAFALVTTLNVVLWPDEDASIGSGLILMAIPAAIVPLALWLLLRRLGVPGAVLIGAGGIAVYLAAIQIGTEQSTWAPVYVTAAAGAALFAVYAGLATVVAGAIAGRKA